MFDLIGVGEEAVLVDDNMYSVRVALPQDMKDDTMEKTTEKATEKALSGQQDVLKDVLKELPERQRVMLGKIREDVRIMNAQLAGKMSVSERTVRRDIVELQAMGVLHREGRRKDGKWVIDCD